MTGDIFALGAALWLGVLTSISPCPLASNIAAISFIAHKGGHPRRALWAGVLYALGRTLAYVILGMVIMAGLMAGGEIARFLQRHLNQALGPILILVGMLLLGLLHPTRSMNLAGAGIQKRAASGGAHWAFVLGVLFALSFCPLSAGLFFGGLIPLAATHSSRLLVPGIYGIGTALPVIVFAMLIAFASRKVGQAFDRLTQIERIVRLATGVVFILAGLFYSLVYVYGIPLTR